MDSAVRVGLGTEPASSTPGQVLSESDQACSSRADNRNVSYSLNDVQTLNHPQDVISTAGHRMQLGKNPQTTQGNTVLFTQHSIFTNQSSQQVCGSISPLTPSVTVLCKQCDSPSCVSSCHSMPFDEMLPFDDPSIVRYKILSVRPKAELKPALLLIECLKNLFMSGQETNGNFFFLFGLSSS